MIYTDDLKEKLRREDFLNCIRRYIKFGNRITSTDKTPFEFVQVLVYEAHDWSSYRRFLGQETVAYLHGWRRSDDSYHMECLYDFKWIKPNRIEIYNMMDFAHIELI